MSKEKPQTRGSTADSNNQPQPQQEKPPLANLNGAAIIDKDGREVPITESMIVDAFDEIKNSDKAE